MHKIQLDINRDGEVLELSVDDRTIYAEQISLKMSYGEPTKLDILGLFIDDGSITVDGLKEEQMPRGEEEL